MAVTQNLLQAQAFHYNYELKSSFSIFSPSIYSPQKFLYLAKFNLLLP